MAGGGRDTPPFGQAAVLGIGLIGASFALAAKAAGAVGRVVGVARREATRNAALAVGAADEVTADPVAAVREADLVYLSTPVGAFRDLLGRLAPVLPAGCLVTDAGSVKAAVCSMAEELLPPTVRFVGGHPMAGSERTGPTAARVDLFEDHPYYLVSTALGGPEAAEEMAALVRAIGGTPVAIGAEEHDGALAVTSHMPHAAAAAVILAVGELVACPSRRRSFAGSGLRDTTRIAAGAPEMWRDVFAANAGPVAEACRLAAARLEDLAALIEAGDDAALVELLATAQRVRKSLDEAGEDSQ